MVSFLWGDSVGFRLRKAFLVAARVTSLEMKAHPTFPVRHVLANV